MIERIIGGIPVWMRAEHPVIRQRMEQEREKGKSSRARRVLLTVFLATLLLIGGYFFASDFFMIDPFDLPFSELLQEWLFWPLFVFQGTLQIVVVLVTLNTVSMERRRQTWDNIRATSDGASMMIRSRWAYLVFYQLRFSVILLTAARLLFIAALFYDMTAFEGEYLRSLASKAIPAISVPAAVFVVALTLAATLLLPVTSLGLNAAFGMLLSTMFKKRTYSVLVQFAMILTPATAVTMLALGVATFRIDPVNFDNLLAWLILFAFAAIADWGLTFLWLSYFGATIWREIPYGYLLGVALIVWVFVQTILADALMAWAVRRAETLD